MATEDSIIHKGHRKRMKEKFVEHGDRVMQSYELLEMLLYNVIPHKDTNPIAKRLMMRFSGLEGVFSADREQLMSVDGVGSGVADFLLKAGALMGYSAAEETRIVYDSYESVGEYLLKMFSSLPKQCVVLLAFDNKMRLIAETVISETDYDSAAVKPEPFLNFLISNRASVAVVAHNHPYGPLFPSSGDMATNTLICDALFTSGLVCAEHYVISGNKYIGISKSIKISLSQSAELSSFCTGKEVFVYE